ncbi:MAG: hypothetical protein KBA06_00870 [Saprospiraceae bacterium]|nr:hypothetical protein [Saprospiraceae bacterium]
MRSYWNQSFALFIIFFALITFGSCRKDDDPNVSGENPYKSGVFITNEGTFGAGSGTVSFYNRTQDSLQQDIFSNVNSGLFLGNVVQSMSVIDSLAYIVINNGAAVKVVNANTFVYKTEISELEQPRFISSVGNNRAYVSQWGSDGLTGSIAVIDLTNNSILTKIDVPAGPEQVLKVGNYVYVPCSGGYGLENKVVKINITTNTIEKTIAVGSYPNSIVQDAQGDIWVLCGSVFDVASGASLVKISNDVVVATLDVLDTTLGAAHHLCTNAAKNALFYLTGTTVRRVDNINGLNPSFSDVIVSNKSYYTFGVDPVDNRLFLGNAGNFTSIGTVDIYSTTGVLSKSLNSGIIPGNFYFR